MMLIQTWNDDGKVYMIAARHERSERDADQRVAVSFVCHGPESWYRSPVGALSDDDMRAGPMSPSEAMEWLFDEIGGAL